MLGPLVLTRIANNPTLVRVQIWEFSSTPGDGARSIPVGDGNIRANDSPHRQLQIPCIGSVVRTLVSPTDDFERHSTAYFRPGGSEFQFDESGTRPEPR